MPQADLTIINGPEPSSLDPLQLSGVEELRAVTPLFEGLTRTDPETGLALPGLAGAWDVSPDGRTYTFHLRTNAAWSSGEPIRADDVTFTWFRVLEPTNGCPYVNLLFPIRGAEAYALGKTSDRSLVGIRELDPVRLRIELESPCAYFLELCAVPTLGLVPRSAIERHGDRWILSRPVPTSGPYQIDFWRLNDRVRLRKNPHYWDAPNTGCDVVDLLSVTAPNTVLNLYHRGDAQIVWDKPLIPTELIPVLARGSDFHSFPFLGSFFLRLNVTRKPFDDVRVRQAFGRSVDRHRLVRRITASGEEPAEHIVPTVTAHYARGEGQTHDPEQARRLLAQAGYPQGRGFPKITLLLDSAVGGASRLNDRLGVELQELWERELGVRVELRRMEKKTYLVAMHALDYDIVRSSWIADYNDPTTFLDLFTTDNGNNRTGWSDGQYDRLLREAAAETNPSRRAASLRDAETRLVRDEAPIIPLWFEAGFTLYRTNEIQGVHANPLDLHPIQAIRRIRPR